MKNKNQHKNYFYIELDTRKISPDLIQEKTVRKQFLLEFELRK